MVKKLKWNLILMSLLYVGLGIFLVMKPGTALNIVCYALGGVVLACAAVQLVRYFVVERGVFQSQLTLISGIICLALGAFLILRSDIVVSILPIVFGLFVIFDSISRVQNALDLRRCGYSSWKSFLLLPVLSVVLGVVLILNPFGAMETLVMAIGIILIMIFLIVIYRMSGVVANIALLVYVLILLGILKYLDATLTLPGIAGIILSMGFAVDANILIFERFKEEVLVGKSLRTSMEAGFRRAFNTILDANVSVMIAAIVLIVMGSGTVKGFAVNLALGLVVSMFTAIVVSRSLLTWFINTGLITNPWFYGLNRKPPEHMLKKGGQK